MTPTHNLPTELGNADCEIVDDSGDLVTIDVGLDGYATVPRGWLTAIPGAVNVELQVPSPGWVGRDKEGDIWHQFKPGWFMRPGSTKPESWNDIQKYGPFQSISGKQAHE